ncbi:MAG TPA: glycosyltransferase [Candidatus Woesebacteria bacterium]|nr:glycosyltransferase [Candidatus Woesebacteria bacterium]HNS95003.1 glycosyltransferase [Candidatus Woesebacteria bacterium]
MHICFILSDFPTLSQTFILNQARYLLERGHALSIFSSYNPNEGISHAIVGMHHLNSRTKYFTNLALEPEKLTTSLDYYFMNLEIDPIDCFHCHFLPNLIALLESIKRVGYPKKQRVPIICTAYGFDVSVLYTQDELAWITHEDVTFIAISDSIKQRLIYLGIPPNRIFILPLGVDMSIFKYQEREPHIPRKFVSVSRLVEKKGLGDGITAFREICRSNGQFVYDIYGSGPEENILRSLIKNLNLENQVFLKGSITHTQLAQTLATYDFFLSPSKTAKNGDSEGQVLGIQEAESVGTSHYRNLPQWDT